MPITGLPHPRKASDFYDPPLSAQRGGFWKDLVALVRSAGFVCRVEISQTRDYVAAYQRAVTPIAESVLGRPESHPYTDDPMCEECIRVCLFLAGYCKMAGVAARVEVALLGAAVARVYDDLIDDYGDDTLLARLSVLFAGGVFEPANDAERLFYLLYSELERRLGCGRDHPIYEAMIALHKAQARSREQRDLRIPTSRLVEIAQEKGGCALLVLQYLVKPDMSAAERNVMRRLGGLMQMIDDHQDVEVDRRAGVATTATRGLLSLALICRQLREMRPSVRVLYGRDQPLFGLIYMSLCVTFLRRYLPEKLIDGPVQQGLVRCVRLNERLRD